MSLSHSGSIHVVQNDAKSKRGLPSSISSSKIVWYAASFEISCWGRVHLTHRTFDEVKGGKDHTLPFLKFERVQVDNNWNRHQSSSMANILTKMLIHE